MAAGGVCKYNSLNWFYLVLTVSSMSPTPAFYNKPGNTPAAHLPAASNPDYSLLCVPTAWSSVFPYYVESSQEHTFLKCIQYLNEASSLNTKTPLRKIKSFSDQTTKTQSGWNPQMTSWLHTEHFVFTRKQKEEHFPVKKTTQKQRRILWVDTHVSFTRVAHTAKKPKTNSDTILTCSTCCTLTVGSLFLHWHLTFSYTTTADHIKHCRSLLCHLFVNFHFNVNTNSQKHTHKGCYPTLLDSGLVVFAL